MIAHSSRIRSPLGVGTRTRMRVVAALAVTAVLAAAFGIGRGMASSAALFTATQPAVGNVLTVGTWQTSVTWYLHNNPTPPVGNTTAQSSLTMNATPPGASTLYNYDTNADSQPGRRLRRSGSGPGETNLARYASWRSPALTSARLIDGTASLILWNGVQDFQLNRAGGIVAYLRDYDPSTGTYVEIGSATRTSPNWQAGSSTWQLYLFDIPVCGYTVAAGHRVELKVEATSSAYTNMWIAYDTASYASSITLP